MTHISSAVARHDFGEGFCYPCVLNDAVSNLFKEDAEYYLFYSCFILLPFTFENFTTSLNTTPATSNVTYANNMTFYHATAGAESQVG